MCLQTTEKGVVVSHGSQVKVPKGERGGRQGETWARAGGLGADAGPAAELAVSEALGAARAAVRLGLGVLTSFC